MNFKVIKKDNAVAHSRVLCNIAHRIWRLLAEPGSPELVERVKASRLYPGAITGPRACRGATRGSASSPTGARSYCGKETFPSGPMRIGEGKGTVFEGGVRVPCVMRWPGSIPAGIVQNEPAMTIDTGSEVRQAGRIPEE